MEPDTFPQRELDGRIIQILVVRRKGRDDFSRALVLVEESVIDVMRHYQVVTARSHVIVEGRNLGAEGCV